MKRKFFSLILVGVLLLRTNVFASEFDELATFTSDFIDVPCSTKGADIRFTKFTVNGDMAYCLNRGLNVPDGKEVKLLEYTDSQKMVDVLKNGYPSLTPEGLGVNSIDEAQFATQLALWSISSGDEDLVNNLKPKIDHEEEMTRVIAATKRIMTATENSPEQNIVIFSHGDEKVEMVGKYLLCGPYSLSASNFSLTNVVCTTESGDELPVVDSEWREIKDFSGVNEVYVKCELEHLLKNVDLKFYGQTTLGAIYGTGNDEALCQNYLVLKYENQAHEYTFKLGEVNGQR